MNLNCQIVFILYETFKIISDISLKHETLTTIPPFHVCINKINITFVFKMKGRYEVELQTTETMKLFSRAKTLIDQTKNGKNAPRLEAVEEALVQCNLADNQYQQMSEVLLIFTLKFVYLLNVGPSNLVFLKT